MVDMHGCGNAVGRGISCGCLYTLPPLRIGTPISPTPILGVGSSRRGVRVHGPRLKHLCNYCWRDTIDGRATVLFIFIFRCIREHGHGRSGGEAVGIKSAAGLGCSFVVHDDVVVFVDMVQDAGRWLERGRRTLGFFEGVRGECGVLRLDIKITVARSTRLVVR